MQAVQLQPKQEKKHFRFEKAEVGDFVKFKAKNKDKCSVHSGIITDISKDDHLGVKVPRKDREDYIDIDRRSVLQIYSSKYIPHLTPRLALKHIWKEFIFREVKTTKCTELLHVDYKYIGSNGFERVIRYPNLEEAHLKVEPEFHKNLIPCYSDFFGFTTDKAIRNNDHHYDHEIFFSKKCYCELDWSELNPTGDFLISERGNLQTPPIADSIICGIVENGEKGLFYRKWFLCSKEFLTLWTMVCDPSDSSLMENNIHILDNEWVKIKKEKKIKDFDKLLNELDTSYYSVNLKVNLEERKKKYCFYNLERTALYYTNRYKEIAEAVFSRGFISDNNSYSEESFEKSSPFQKNLIRNLLWPKKLL